MPNSAATAPSDSLVRRLPIPVDDIFADDVVYDHVLDDWRRIEPAPARSQFPSVGDEARVTVHGATWTGATGRVASVHGAIGMGTRPSYGIEIHADQDGAELDEAVTVYLGRDEFTLTGWTF